LHITVDFLPLPPPKGAVNQGAELAPYRTKQEEVGYKVALDRMNLTADVFRIRRCRILRSTSTLLMSAAARETMLTAIELMDIRLRILVCAM